MPLTNLNNQHLDASQKKSIESLVADLEAKLQAIDVQMTAQDRQQYGSINEQNKLFVNKSGDFYNTSPKLSSPEVDWTEFANDAASRNFYESIINRLEGLITKLKNAKTLHDYDNYQAALRDYSYTAYMAGGGNPDFEQKYNELKQFFAKGSKAGIRSREARSSTEGTDSSLNQQDEPLK